MSQKTYTLIIGTCDCYKNTYDCVKQLVLDVRLIRSISQVEGGEEQNE